MSILTGHEIRNQVANGDIKVSPYNEENVQPNSLDLTLGKQVCVYEYFVMGPYGSTLGITSFEVSRQVMLRGLEEPPDAWLDPKRENPVLRFEMDRSGWLLKPGILYLMHVVEDLHAPNHVMTLSGKSSLARLGIIVHFTAGHGETGFNGQFTIESSGMHPVRLYPDMDIAQVLFQTVEGEREDYQKRGNYVGEAARGAQPSRSWRQFLGR